MLFSLSSELSGSAISHCKVGAFVNPSSVAVVVAEVQFIVQASREAEASVELLVDAVVVFHGVLMNMVNRKMAKSRLQYQNSSKRSDVK